MMKAKNVIEKAKVTAMCAVVQYPQLWRVR